MITNYSGDRRDKQCIIETSQQTQNICILGPNIYKTSAQVTPTSSMEYKCCLFAGITVRPGLITERPTTSCFRAIFFTLIYGRSLIGRSTLDILHIYLKN